MLTITKLLNFHDMIHRINRKLVAENHKVRTVNDRQGKHWELISTTTAAVVQVWTSRTDVHQFAQTLGVLGDAERVLFFGNREITKQEFHDNANLLLLM